MYLKNLPTTLYLSRTDKVSQKGFSYAAIMTMVTEQCCQRGQRVVNEQGLSS